jgi:aldose sugar dehydrogenase
MLISELLSTNAIVGYSTVIILFLCSYPATSFLGSINVTIPASGQQGSLSLPQVNDRNLRVELVADRLLFPTSMSFLDNNSLLVTQKNNGDLISVINGAVKSQPIISVQVDNASDRGLLGVATMDNKPSSPDAKFVFLYFTESNGQDQIRNRVYRYEWNPENQTLANATMVLDLPAEPGPDQNGGKLEVDRSGNLYAVIGELNRDGKLQNIRQGSAADDTSVIIRIRQDGSAVADNPFFNSADQKMQKYYAYGIRNSFGLAVDPISGFLWDTENGPNAYDEMNIVQPGFNSGWQKVMGPASRSNITQAGIEEELVIYDDSKYRDPIFSWKDSIGLADLEFLNSTALGFEYAFNIFVGDSNNNGNLYYFELNSTRTGIKIENNLLADSVADDDQELSQIVFGTGFFGGITDIETGPDGFLYVLTLNGSIYRILPASESNEELAQPTTASNRIDGNSAEEETESGDDGSVQADEEQQGGSGSDNPLSLRSLSTNEGGSPVLGSPEAPVIVVDFSDFQCPRCARYVKSTEPEIKKEYVETGKIALIFKHFPRLGEDSLSAALASECANEQGKFWEYHDALFQNQQGENSGWASKEKLKEFASEVRLDRQQFDSCLDSEKYKSHVDRDLALVKELDLQTTPSFLILKSDGTEMEVLTGAHPFPSFKALIDKKIP